MTFEELTKRIRQLRSILSKCDVYDIIGNVFLQMQKTHDPGQGFRELTSPYRQCNFILANTVAVPLSGVSDKEPTKIDWAEICRLTEEIYSYYGLMHMPQNNDFSTMSEERHKQGMSALPSLLLSVSAGPMASIEQITENILGIFMPMADEIENTIGLSLKDIIQITDDVVKLLNGRLDASYRCVTLKNELSERIESGEDPVKVLAALKAESTKNDVSDFLRIGKFRPDEISSVDITKVQRYFDLFSFQRVEEELAIFYPTDEMPLDGRPILQLKNGEYGLAYANTLHNNIYSFLETLAKQLDDKKFRRCKSDFLESDVERLFRTFFAEQAKVFANVFEEPNSTLEHDLVVLFKRTMIIVESKAGSIRKGIRDIEKSYPRIQSNFQDTIQTGADQANRLAQRLLSANETVLYNKRGKPLTTLKRSDFDNVECVVVTLDNEGVLATRLALHLKLGEGQAYPWCANLYDLKQIVEFREELNIAPELFLQYLQARKPLHSLILNDDELDIFGYFLEKGNFKRLLKGKPVGVQVPLLSSDMFNQAYLHRRVGERYRPMRKSGTRSNEEKVGRNEPCPCGSGKKFKKCHGSG